MEESPRLTRRRLLELGVALPVMAAACSRAGESDETARSMTSATAGSGTTLAPTPACEDGDEPTPAQTEGPFFTPESPERASFLEPAIEGTRLLLLGAVVAADCKPIAGALLDFWHADASGEYDNDGYRLRGHQFADERGGYRLATIVPGRYTGRTRHIHVKVQAPHNAVLTTQLYFPGEPDNEADGLFDPGLVVSLRETPDGLTARFRFVLDLA